MEEQKNDAYEYALLIRREIIALETLLENGQDIADDLERVRDGDAPEMNPDTLAECADAQDELGITEWPDDYQDIFSTYLDETCLDMTVLRVVNKANYEDRTRVEILRTCGGPRCDIYRDTNDGDIVEIAVNSGGDSSTLRVSVPNVASHIDAIAECY